MQLDTSLQNFIKYESFLNDYIQDMPTITSNKRRYNIVFSLYNLVIENNFEELEQRLKHCSFDEINKFDINGDTLLRIAVSNGYYQIVQLLLRNKADPNIIYSNGKTILMDAIINNDVKMVKLLLNEITLTANLTKDRSEINYAYDNKQKEIFELLFQRSEYYIWNNTN